MKVIQLLSFNNKTTKTWTTKDLTDLISLKIILNQYFKLKYWTVHLIKSEWPDQECNDLTNDQFIVLWLKRIYDNFTVLYFVLQVNIFWKRNHFIKKKMTWPNIHAMTKPIWNYGKNRRFQIFHIIFNRLCLVL